MINTYKSGILRAGEETIIKGTTAIEMGKIGENVTFVAALKAGDVIH